MVQLGHQYAGATCCGRPLSGTARAVARDRTSSVAMKATPVPELYDWLDHPEKEGGVAMRGAHHGMCRTVAEGVSPRYTSTEPES